MRNCYRGRILIIVSTGDLDSFGKGYLIEFVGPSSPTKYNKISGMYSFTK